VNTQEQIFGRSVITKIKSIEEMLKVPKFSDMIINFITSLGKKRFFREALIKLCFAMLNDVMNPKHSNVKKVKDHDKTEEELEEIEDLKAPKTSSAPYNEEPSSGLTTFFLSLLIDCL